MLHREIREGRGCCPVDARLDRDPAGDCRDTRKLGRRQSNGNSTSHWRCYYQRNQRHRWHRRQRGNNRRLDCQARQVGGGSGPDSLTVSVQRHDEEWPELGREEVDKGTAEHPLRRHRRTWPAPHQHPRNTRCQRTSSSTSHANSNPVEVPWHPDSRQREQWSKQSAQNKRWVSPKQWSLFEFG